MTVLVTGGGGMIGARIVRALLARGETVVSCDMAADQPRLDSERENPTLRRVAGDVRDGDRLRALMREHKVERVIHMAALLVPLTEDEPAIGFAVNITGATNVFEAARHSGVRRVCYATSMSTYGDQSKYGAAAVDEESERHPYSLYGYAKLINEETAKAYTRNFGLDTRGIRIASVFGHGRLTGRSGAISRMISAAAVGARAVSDVAAEQEAPLIYVDDVAECMARLCVAENLTLPVYAGLNVLATVQAAADIVRRYIPDADIRFAPDAVTYLTVKKMDGTRLERAIDYRLPPLERRVLDHINEARAERQMPPVG
jgi:nucleoside-diphosphate-sugar epimerase